LGNDENEKSDHKEWVGRSSVLLVGRSANDNHHLWECLPPSLPYDWYFDTTLESWALYIICS